MLKVGADQRKRAGTKHDGGPPDLQTQFETLLDQVWRSEAEWRLWDRIDALCASDPEGCGPVPEHGSQGRSRRSR